MAESCAGTAGIARAARHVDLSEAVCATPSASEDRQDQAEQNADDNAGDDRKIKGGVAALDPNVAGQTSQPFWGEAAPENKTNHRRDYADDDQEFPEVAHERRLR